jgi:hypothetical protein
MINAGGRWYKSSEVSAGFLQVHDSSLEVMVFPDYRSIDAWPHHRFFQLGFAPSLEYDEIGKAFLFVSVTHGSQMMMARHHAQRAVS